MRSILVRACAVEMHMDTKAILRGNLLEIAAPQKLGARFVRACAVDMHWTFIKEILEKTSLH